MTVETPDFITVLLKYGIVFLLIFAIVFLLAVLTPWMAKKVDAILLRFGKGNKESTPEDPRCKQVRGIYDMPESDQGQKTTSDDLQQGEEL